VKIIKVSIVEDISEVRDGLKYLLNIDQQIDVSKTYRCAEDFLKELGSLDPPDVVLMDIKLPGINGIEATKIIKKMFPEITILILTIFEDEERILDSIRAGADGYILKNTKPGQLADQIKSACNGGSPISPLVARRILSEIQKEKKDSLKKNYNLTRREKEVLKDIVDGYTYRQIAEKHFIAGSTAKKHILHIYQKLNVTSKAEFVKKVIDENLI